MRARLALVALLVLAALAGTAPSAGAAGPAASFELRADGYRVVVDGRGENVSVDVHRERRHGEALSSYTVHGTVARERLRARFGNFGSVSMRFRTTRVTRPRGCRGRHRFRVRHGEFVGSFRFRGEGGYVSVSARRAKGTVREVAPDCRGRRPLARAARAGVPHSDNVNQRPEFGYVFGSWRHAGSSAAVLASKSRRGGTEVIADQEATRGAMSIFRLAVVRAGPRALRTDDALTRAWLTAPAPFAGRATFRAAADGHRTWEGGLTVDFPGLEGYPLTGSRYDTEIGRTASPGFLFFLLYF